MSDYNRGYRQGIYSLKKNSANYVAIASINTKGLQDHFCSQYIVNTADDFFTIIDYVNYDVYYLKGDVLKQKLHLYSDDFFVVKEESTAVPKYQFVDFCDYDYISFFWFVNVKGEHYFCIYDKKENQPRVYKDIINDITKQPLGLLVMESMDNSMIMAAPGGFDAKGEELNLVLNIIHLKKQ